MDYDFAILDFSDDSPEAAARRRGWIEAVLRGFRDDRPDDDAVARWVKHYRNDRVTVRGAWLPEGEFGAGPMPVATYASLDKTLNAGRELLPLRMITDVTTSATHRRQGLLRRMIEDDLADAVAAGVPMAALTAAEATIYGRWGFGPATFRVGVDVDTTPGFGFRDFVDPGRVEQLEPSEAWPHVKSVFDAFHARQRGSVEWPSPYEDMHTAAWDPSGGGANRKLRGAVHLDASGAVDGFVLWKPGEDNAVKVDEMATLTPQAQLALWSFLASMDRVTKVSFNLFHPEDPLAWALTDLNRVRTTEVKEFLWLRVLDVPRCLVARPWSADGSVVLEVDDPQGHTSGRYAVTTADGVATVTRTDGDPDVRLTSETLGSLHLGAVPVRMLHRAGRLEGSEEAVRRFGAMADLAEPPYSLTGF
ncbi:enhanced intracellular survival protein [Nocardioides flavus (ex Wang et al. 2016)]|uniref:Enhanced intracellular survival protein n=1 Tax=Nocardioides flavus (ex Wang et al. 2016) TaxID=2058780 RepID=A0ABQ3HG15_9ACTN|nr:GNAT family N-acetyltransferase [Nocardioides flavus (ex Wang et al. 2016)]GHE16550.1 enhanced intracellular survival protein [Nocardioides flavus (ex Wang et al. 2016)]